MNFWHLAEMNTTYFRVRLSLVPRPQEQEITTFCFAHQALGISEVLNFSQPDLTYDPSLIPRRLLELDVFFEGKPAADFFTDLLKINSQIMILENEEENTDNAESEDTVDEVEEKAVKKSNKKPMIQRYKGLGEMNSEELWETTMDPKTRTLKSVTVDHAEEADRVFEMLMGSEVGPRKSFIQTHAKQANLDF